jgi:uncharacterized Zn-finger protein
MRSGKRAGAGAKSMSVTVTRPVEVIQVNERAVSCDGGGGRLGHPRVYLRMQGPLGHPATQVTCPYCSRLYILSGDPAEDDGH